MTLEELVVKITGDTSGLNNAVEQANSKLSGLGNIAGKAAGAVGAGVAAMGAATVAATKAIVDNTVELSSNLDVIDKASQRMNVSAESYQKLSYAAGMSGVEMSTLEQAAKKLAASGSDLSLDEALDQILAIGDASERSAAAAELFGDKAAYSMAPMLNAGADGIRALYEEAEQYGLVMSSDKVAAGAKFGDSLSKMQQTITATKNQMLADFLPGMTDVVDGFADMLAGVDGGKEKFVEGIQGFVDTASEKLPEFLDLAFNIVETVLQGLIDNLPALLETVGDMLKQAITFIKDNLPEIIQAITDFVVEATPEVIELGVDLFVALVENLPAIISGIVAAIPKIIAALVKGIVEAVPKMAEAGLQLVKGLFNGISNAVGWLYEKLKGWVSSVLDFIKGLFGIHSPSTVMAEYGVFLDKGLANGIDKGTADVYNAVDKIGDVVENGLGFGEFDVSAKVRPVLAAGGLKVSGESMTATLKATNGDTVSALIQMTRQLISAIEDNKTVIKINDKDIAESAARGNNEYKRLTGVPIIA